MRCALHLHHQHWARTRRVLNIRVNPKEAGVRKDSDDPFSTTGTTAGGLRWHQRMAPQLSATGIKPEGMLQALRAVLPEGSPPRQGRSEVPLGLKHAEAIGWEQ